jgi:long-chain acyl-CoA synthetase
MEQIQRLFDIVPYQLEHYPQDVALAARQGKSWWTISSEEFQARVNQVSAGLLQLDVEVGDRIALMSDNRPEWNFVDLGAQQIGAVPVPIYPRFNNETCSYILSESGARIGFAENADCFDKVSKVRDKAPALEKVFSLESSEKTASWTEALPEVGRKMRDEIDARREAIQEQDLATIIYTSGTTGQPKGVMLSHKNILSNIKATVDLVPLNEQHAALSLLPLSHVFERMVVYLYMTQGVSIYYAKSPDTFSDDIQDVKPHVLTVVPRLLEKVHERIISRALDQPLPLRMIFFWAQNLAEEYDLESKNWFYRLQHAVADRLVFRRWQEALGGNLFAIVSGGAPLDERLGRIFTAAGLPILEGYGLTESSPVLAANRCDPEFRRIGSVGKPLKNVQVRIAEDGEILARGPNVMLGYYQRSDATDQVCREGWLHTGDEGKLDEDGFLYVMDRVDSIFKTSGGEFVVPQRVEGLFKQSFLIDHIMIVGRDRKMVTAVISPDFDNLKEWCADHDVPWMEDRAALLRQDAIKNRFERIVEKRNQELDGVERIKRYTLVPDTWTVAGDQLTPTMKIKRHNLRQEYQETIERMYEETK